MTKSENETPEQAEARRAKARKATAAWVARNPDKAKAASKRWRANNPERVRAIGRDWRDRNIVRALVNEARYRAKARGEEFSITVEDVPPMGTHCPLLGHTFAPRVRGVRDRRTPSLDRIDSARGYVPGNVWIVGYRANLVKNDGTADEHEAIALAMRARGAA